MNRALISSSYELSEILLKKYAEDIEVDLFGATKGSREGSIEGALKGERFNISFGSGEYLIISVTNKVLLDYLLPVLNEAMGNEEPIASYCLQTGNMEEAAMPTLEWNIKDPEGRIKELVNDIAYPEESKVLNLILFGNREKETYVESEKEKAERIANTGIYGIVSGKEPQRVKRCRIFHQEVPAEI